VDRPTVAGPVVTDAEERRAAAFHEAGHLVAAAALGLPIGEVALEGPEAAEHRVAGWPKPPGHLDQERVRAYLCAALAGAMAEQRALGRRPASSAHTADVDFVTGFVLEHARSIVDQEGLAEHLQGFAWSLLEPAWADVEAIAAALLAHGRLGADEARRMAEGTPVEE